MSVRSLHPSLIGLDDEALVARWQDGDPAALELLLDRYRRFARSKARTYFLVGGDRDDVEQEGLIGLYKAARDYRTDRQASFRAFAEVCVTRQVITAVKAATRHKHQPLNRYVTISGARSDVEHQRELEALLDALTEPDPADAVVSAEAVRRIGCAVTETLSGFEVDVLRLYVSGRSYDEIGGCLGRPTKSVDNALQRIKRKLGRRLEHQQGELTAPPLDLPAVA